MPHRRISSNRRGPLDDALCLRWKADHLSHTSYCNKCYGGAIFGRAGSSNECNACCDS